MVGALTMYASLHLSTTMNANPHPHSPPPTDQVQGSLVVYHCPMKSSLKVSSSITKCRMARPGKRDFNFNNSLHCGLKPLSLTTLVLCRQAELWSYSNWSTGGVHHASESELHTSEAQHGSIHSIMTHATTTQGQHQNTH